MTYTNGVWSVGIDDEPTEGCEAIEVLAPFGNNGGHICVAYVNGLTEDLKIDDETRSNARLIAAAPELLEALEIVFPLAFECLTRMPEYSSRVKTAQLAIAKARGEI